MPNFPITDIPDANSGGPNNGPDVCRRPTAATPVFMTNLVDQYVGATAYDVSGDKIGKIHKLFVDGRSKSPGGPRAHRPVRDVATLIPLTGARQEGRAVTLTGQ